MNSTSLDLKMKGVIMECSTPVLWDLLNLRDKASVLHNWILRTCNILNLLQVTSLSWVPMECNTVAEILQKVIGGITVSNWICCKQGHIMASKSHLTRSFSFKLICEGCWRLWVCYLLHTRRVFLSWSL